MLVRSMDAGPNLDKSEITSGQATSVDYGFTAISPQENPSLRMETPESTQTPVLAPAPEINHPDPHAAASPWSSVHRQEQADNHEGHGCRSRGEW